MAAVASINLNLNQLNAVQQKTFASLQAKIKQGIKLTSDEQEAYNKFIKMAIAASNGGNLAASGCGGGNQQVSGCGGGGEPDLGTVPSDGPTDPNKPPPPKTHKKPKGHKSHPHTATTTTGGSKPA